GRRRPSADHHGNDQPSCSRDEEKGCDQDWRRSGCRRSDRRNRRRWQRCGEGRGEWWRRRHGRSSRDARRGSSSCERHACLCQVDGTLDRARAATRKVKTKVKGKRYKVKDISSTLYLFPFTLLEFTPIPEPSYIPERRRVLPLERVGALIEILICSGFPTQVLLILVMRGFGMPMHAADGRLSPPFVFTLSLLDAALVIGLVLMFLRAHHESPREV